MAIRSSLYFIFDGQKSTDFGISNINIGDGMLTESFLATRQINEVKIRGRDKPYYVGITHSPLSFTLQFGFNNSWTQDTIRKISRWLSVEQYKPLQFSDNLDRVYFAMLDSSSDLIHNGSKLGYISLTVRCDSPYTYSPTYLSNTYDFSSNTGAGSRIILNNLGDASIFPEIWIYKVGAGEISIVNNSNGGETFAYTGLADTETVYTDCTNQVITSDQIPVVYRMNNFNNNYLELVCGSNNLSVFGNAKIYFRYQFIYTQG